MVHFFKPKPKEVSTKHFSLNITDIDMKGRGVARLNNVTWFVQGALPGEEVVVRTIDLKKDIGNAELISVKKRSDDRVKPLCENYDKCGGCSLQHVSIEKELEAKVNGIKRAFKKLLKIDIFEPDETVVMDESGYRRVCRLSIQADRKEYHLGFREEFGKKIVEVNSCLVLIPFLSDLIEPLRKLYGKFSNFKLIGHIELVKANPKPVILFRVIAELPSQDLELIKNFANEHSVIAYVLTHYKRGKEELEDHDEIKVLNEELLEGNPKPYYEIDGLKIYFLPNDFVQINEEMNKRLVHKALSYLDLNNNDEVLDLYCGVGNFSLPMAKIAKHVYAVEGVWDMVKAGELNAKLNSLDNLQFCVHNLDEDFEKTIWAKSNITKLLLDPGREGAFKVVNFIAKRKIKDLVYVSCNPLTMVRDLDVLLKSGYEIKKWSVFDMFPRTSHVETVILMSRKE